MVYKKYYGDINYFFDFAAYYINNRNACSLSFWSQKKDLLLVVLINILTNPTVVLCSYLTGNQRTFQILLEMIVIFIEGCYYKKYSSDIKYGFCLTATANILSYIVGLILVM